MSPPESMRESPLQYDGVWACSVPKPIGMGIKRFPPPDAGTWVSRG